MVFYCVTLTTSSDSKFMVCNIINFWIFIPNSASALIHSWEFLKDAMLLLQCSLWFYADSLLRSSERCYVVAAMFYLLLRWFTPEKFWKYAMLLLQWSIRFCFWMWLYDQASEVLLLRWRLWISQARRWRSQGYDWRFWFQLCVSSFHASSTFHQKLMNLMIISSWYVIK